MAREKGFLFLSIIVCLIICGYFVFAWDEPGSIPPGGNVLPPINVSSDPQTKIGALNIDGGIGAGGVGYNSDYGIVARGPSAGGKFFSEDGDGIAILGYGDVAMNGYGSFVGGYFYNYNHEASVWLATNDKGLHTESKIGIGGFNLVPISPAELGATELGISDSAGNLILIFD